MKKEILHGIPVSNHKPAKTNSEPRKYYDCMIEISHLFMVFQRDVALQRP